MKASLAKNLPQQTKIFDEIDSGVSGGVAHSIGLKIKEISKDSQVLCITHLAQVASLATNHIKISKEIKDGRTFTVIENLNKEEKVKEIAAMLSNGNVTESSLSLASEMINEK